MRILQVISGVDPNFGGPSVGSARLNEALNRTGSHAVLISTTLANSGHSVLDVDELRALGSHELRLLAYPPSRPVRLHNSWGALRAIWRQVQTADAVHIHGQHRMPSVWAYICAVAWGTPYGVQVHGILEPFQREKSKGKKWAFDLIVGSGMLNRATYVLFASQVEAERARDVVPDSRALVHPLGADLPPGKAPNLTAEQVRIINSAPRERRVCFLGRLARKKQPDLLIRAWAKLDRPDAVLIIAGPDDDLGRAELELLAAGLGVKERVAIVGPLSGGERTWLFQQCAIFALPSLNENFGIAVGEAMLAGCHVICSSEVAASAHLDAAKSGTVLPELNEDVVVEAVQVALDSSEYVAGSGRRAQQYAKQHLTWDQLAEAVSRRIAQARLE